MYRPLISRFCCLTTTLGDGIILAIRYVHGANYLRGSVSQKKAYGYWQKGVWGIRPTKLEDNKQYREFTKFYTKDTHEKI